MNGHLANEGRRLVLDLLADRHLADSGCLLALNWTAVVLDRAGREVLQVQ